MALQIAYLAQGRVRLKVGDEPARTLESPYAEDIRNKALRAQQRNSWKSPGTGFLSGSILWGARGAAQGLTPVLITSLSRGAMDGQLIYSLESGPLCALLAAEPASHDERRIWNNNNFRLQHVRACPQTGNLAFSVVHSNGTANLGVMFKGEGGLKELTEGDSVDTSPQWVPGKDREILFQSAGVGRNREGHFLALGPFSIQKLNIDTGEMTPVLEDSHNDYLSPRLAADGTLYYIRRPYKPNEGIQPWKLVKDFCLFPFRLLFAIFQFLNFFSMSFTGRKLSTAGDTQTKEMDLRQMMIYGNLVRAQQQIPAEDDAPDLVPSNWQLVRRHPDGHEDIIAKGVLAFDVGHNGVVAYSNGSAVFACEPSHSPKRIVSEAMVEQIVIC